MANLTHPIHPRRNACAFRVRDFEQSTGLFNPASPDRLSPPHGAGQRMQSIRVTDGAKACLRGVGASLPPLGSGAAVQIDYTPYLPGAFLAKSAFDISILPPEGLIGAAPQPCLTPTRSGSADAKHPRHRRSEGLPSRSRRFASHPSVRARRFLFRSPHTSPAKCLRIPRSRL